MWKEINKIMKRGRLDKVVKLMYGKKKRARNNK